MIYCKTKIIMKNMKQSKEVLLLVNILDVNNPR